jgi:hypothetical protein
MDRDFYKNQDKSIKEKVENISAYQGKDLFILVGEKCFILFYYLWINTQVKLYIPVGEKRFVL